MQITLLAELLWSFLLDKSEEGDFPDLFRKDWSNSASKVNADVHAWTYCNIQLHGTYIDMLNVSFSIYSFYTFS